MTEPIREVALTDGHSLIYNDEKHSYIFRGPKVTGRQVSVTTITGASWSIEGLLHWANKLGREGRFHTEARDEAAVSGTTVHAQLESLAKTGKSLDLKDRTPHERGCLSAVAAWHLEHDPTYVESEVIVGSVAHRYAGRFDLLAEVMAELGLIDLKSTHANGKIRDKAWPQLAGYALARAEMLDEPPIRNRWTLLAKADGKFEFVRDPAPVESEAEFLAALAHYRAKGAREKAFKAGLKEAVPA